MRNLIIGLSIGGLIGLISGCSKAGQDVVLPNPTADQAAAAEAITAGRQEHLGKRPPPPPAPQKQ